MTAVRRFDSTSVKKWDSTPQGFLRVDARLTKVGIFQYQDSTGKVTREFRPPDEVFAPESIASLSGAPVTDFHPPEFVTPGNYRELAVGHVAQSIKQDGRYLEANIQLTHADAIQAVQDGKRKEISCGYNCVVDPTPGTWQGQHYDSVQRKITYNHIAILPSGHGRQGKDVCMRLDSGDAICMAESDLLVSEKEGMELQERLDAAEKRNKELESQVGALQAEKDSIAAALESYKAQERKDARDALEAAAKKVLGDKADFNGKSDREVREACILKLQPEKRLDGLSDDFVSGAFAYLTTASLPTVKNPKLAEVRATLDSKSEAPAKTMDQIRSEAIAERNSRWKLTSKEESK